MYDASSVYDAADAEIVRFGGFNSAVVQTNETWIFSHGQWSNITATAGPAPAPGYLLSMAYDPVDGYVVAWGGEHFGTGCPAPFPGCNGTYSFVGNRWSLLPTMHTPPGQASSNGGPIAYDAADQYVVLFDASFVQTWAFAHGQWRQLGTGTNGTYQEPGGRDSQEMSITYDSADGYVLLFGGYSTTGAGCPGVDYACNATWKFLGGNWTELTPAGAPSARAEAAMVYDAADGYVLLWGGWGTPTSGPSLVFNDTWEFLAGAWTQLAVGIHPIDGNGATMAFDAADNVTVLFSGSPVGGNDPQRDTWEWGAHPTQPPTLNLSLQDAAAGADATTNSSLGALRITGGFASPEAPYYTTSVVFGDGTAAADLPLVEAYSTSGFAEYTTVQLSHDYSAAGNYSARAWANDTTGASTTVAWTVTVASAVGATLSATNLTPVLGQSIEIMGTVTGGHRPYSYAYSGLPFGCSTVNSSSIGCLPTQAGNFSVQLAVNDSWGGSATASLPIQIVFGFTVVAPATTVIGRPLSIGLEVPANVGLVNYSYAGLPPGCSTVDAPQLTCTPTSTGDFHVEITAVSSSYGAAERSISLQVLSQGAGSGVTVGTIESVLLGALAGGLVIGVVAVVWWRRRRGTSSPPPA